MSYKLNPTTGKLDYFEAGSGSADLSTVLNNGNTSGANDIEFDAAQGLLFNNSSRLREGTIDAGLGGTKGIAQICAVGYELKWEAGRLYVMDGNGVYIRHSLYNFTLTPTVNDDVTKGYLPGSRWSLDNGDTYLCTDETTGAAVWVKEVIPIANISMSTAKLLGRTTAGTGAAEEITVGTGLSLLAGNLTAVNAEGWTVIVKSANQNVVNSSTLVDDTELQFSVVAGGNYMIQMSLATAGDSSINDYRFAFITSAGTMTGSGNAICRNAANSPVVNALNATGASITSIITVGQVGNINGITTGTIDFGFYATSNGIFKFQFALNSGASGIARTCKGTILKYKRLD
jgi:hypothetical protein